MSDPFKGSPDKLESSSEKSLSDNLSKQSKTEGEEKIYPDLESMKAALKKEHEPEDPHLTKIDINFSHHSTGGSAVGAQRPPFILRKAEFTKESDNPQHFKPLINDFLKETTLKEDPKLSALELKNIKNRRLELSEAQTIHDALTFASELSRLYKELKYLEEEKKVLDLIAKLDDKYHQHQLYMKEIEKMHSPDITTSPSTIRSFSHLLTKRALQTRIRNLSGGKVIVVGDLLVDEILEGNPERISREAPVIVLEHVKTELIAGGAANTATNIAALGGICHALGVCGRDEYARKLGRLLDTSSVLHSLIEDPSRPTTVKTRIMSSSHAMRQQLLRLDRISRQKISPEISSRILERLQAIAGQYKAVILSDYKAGLITNELVHGCLNIAQQRGLPVVVDAQDDFARFNNVALITPNEADTEAAVGFKINTEDDLVKAGKKMLEISCANFILLTRGSKGMVLFQKNQPMFELPAFNKSEVFDVTGAGDTVVATTTLALVTGSSIIEAIALGNLAAGVVVKKPGTAVASQKELLEALTLLDIDE